MRGAILLLVAFTNAANAQAQSASYINEQFGYAIRYPTSLLKPAAQAEDSDGRAFVSTVGHAGFRVFATPMANRSPAQIADEAQRICPGGRPSYRVAKAALVAISCTSGDHIVYQKSLLRNGLAITVRGEYPARERATWDPVVTSIARSMAVADSP
jgi:hypothetical protein